MKKELKGLYDLCISNGIAESDLKPYFATLENNLKTKRYGLVWEEQLESVVSDLQDKFPILVEREDLSIKADANGLTNCLIEGDNYESLTFLKNSGVKVDCIYIDPPYNTGNQDFVYNDKYIDSEDTWRHSSWLSFMNKRLKLAKELLTEDGVIFISIDEYEFAQLKLLCDSIFGVSNFIENFIWIKNSTKNNSNTTSTNHEYVLCYSKNIFYIKEIKEYFRIKKNGYDDVLYFIKNCKNKGLTYSDAQVELRKFLKSNKLFKGVLDYNNVDSNFNVFSIADSSAPSGNGPRYDVLHPKTGKPCTVPGPGWRYKEETMLEHLKNGRIHFGSDEKNVPRFKRYLTEVESEVQKSIILDNTDGKKELMSLFMGDTPFNNPKPTTLIKTLLSGIPNINATVLDFFAGSGTTGHAVLELNKEDGGTRQFILCTNNEVSYQKEIDYLEQIGKVKGTSKKELTNSFKEYIDKDEYEFFKESDDYEKLGICRSVTYERLKRVIKGYTTPKGLEVEGISSNLKYFKVNHIGSNVNHMEIEDVLIENIVPFVQFKHNVWEKETVAEDLIELTNESESVFVYSNTLYLCDGFYESINSSVKPTTLYIYDGLFEFLDEERLVNVNILSITNEFYKN